MTRVLITSGPTRQYFDPVRYLTNGSSGMMGACLAEACIQRGMDVTLVTGPVFIDYPTQLERIDIVSTEELLEACVEAFPRCDGLIAAAAPCDYRPRRIEPHKISKTGGELVLEMIETPDVVATLGANKRDDQWMVGFALETEDQRFRALTKLEKKSCDLMVLNGPHAMNASDNSVEIIAPSGAVLRSFEGSKRDVADDIVALIAKAFGISTD